MKPAFCQEGQGGGGRRALWVLKIYLSNTTETVSYGLTCAFELRHTAKKHSTVNIPDIGESNTINIKNYILWKILQVIYI